MDRLDPILNAYSVIFFTRSRWLGAVLLGCTLLAPRLGLFGLAGLLIARVAAEWIGFARESVRDGTLLFNPLLVSLALGHLSLVLPLPPAALALLLVFFSVTTVLATAAMNRWMWASLGLPALSLPFVAVCLGMHFVFYAVNRTPLASVGAECLLREPAGLPDAIHGFLQSFGAIFFLPHAGVGLLIFLALLTHSRLSLVFAAVAYAAGRGLLEALGVDAGSSATVWLGFNCVFSGLALGGYFFIPGRAGLALAALAGVGCAVTGLALKVFLLGFNVPPLALPFNLTCLGFVHALRQRATFRTLVEPAAHAGSPEDSFRKSTTEARRFPDLALPALLPPFHGARAVTQSFDGPHTHRGEWRHALDFEVRDEQDRAAPRPDSPLAEYHTMGTPVLAPGAGVVARVVDHVADNAAGENNLDENWGNLVILRLDTGLHVKLGHLKQKSVTVREGDRVAPGALLGLCGNSGRSPIPHLHVQMQASPLIGAPTLPFRLANYIETSGGRRRFRASGVPAQGSVVEPLPPEPRLAAALESFSERADRYRVHAPSGEWTETVDCRLNEAGAFVYRSRERAAALTARVIHRVWYALDFDGRADSLLHWMWMGLPRMPLLRDPRVEWEDQLDVRALLRPPLGWVADITGPFVGQPMMRLLSRLAPADPDHPLPPDEIEVETTVTLPLAAGFSVRPRRIRTRLGRGAALLRLEVETDAGRWRVERVAP